MYRGTVTKLFDYGALVTLADSGARALLHISEISPTRVRSVPRGTALGAGTSCCLRSVCHMQAHLACLAVLPPRAGHCQCPPCRRAACTPVEADQRRAQLTRAWCISSTNPDRRCAALRRPSPLARSWRLCAWGGMRAACGSAARRCLRGRTRRRGQQSRCSTAGAWTPTSEAALHGRLPLATAVQPASASGPEPNPLIRACCSAAAGGAVSTSPTHQRGAHCPPNERKLQHVVVTPTLHHQT